MKLLRSNYFAASVLFLCSGVTVPLEAGRPLPGPKPSYEPLHGTLAFEFGLTPDRIEGQGNLLTPLLRAPDDRSMFFLNGNWSGKGDGNENGSAGLGLRHRFTNPDIIVGVNVFYDYGDYAGHGSNQFGMGIELLSKWFDFRANGYFPQEAVQSFGRYSTTDLSSERSSSSNSQRSSRTTSQAVLIDGGEGFPFPNPDILQITTTTTTANSTTTNTRETKRRVQRTYERQEGFLTGFDLELGGLVPYLDCLAETRIYAGYAFFDDPFGHDINCFTARLESRPVPAVVLDVQYKGDTRLVDYDNHWFYGARVEIPFDLGNLLHGQSPFAGITQAFSPQGSCWSRRKPADTNANRMRNRMNEQIVRNWRPTISRTGIAKVAERTTEDREDQSKTTITVGRTTTVQQILINQPFFEE